MKKKFTFLSPCTLVLLASLAGLNCSFGDLASSPKSAERTSFAEVTAQLDPGGNFYAYLGTAQWLEHLSTKVEAWRTTASGFPDATPDIATNINKAFDIVNHLIKDSGVEDITGLGLSSIEIEKGTFRNKMLLHHYAGTGTGFLWKLGGKEPHALTGLDLLPASTALAGFSDLDLPLLWKVAQDEVGKSGFPEAQEFLTKLPAEFEKNTKLKWDAVLNSIGGEIGFALTLNESNTIPIPLPGGALTIPEPGLLLVLKVNDDTIFNRIDQELKANPQVVSVEQPGLKMRTMPVPLPFVGMLRPTTASSGGYLFIASSDALVNEALAVKSGKSPGLKGTDEFKHIAKGIPDQGNQFTYMSERFGRIMFQVQEQVMSGQMAQGGAQAAQAKWMQSLFHGRPAFAYSVGVNTPQGCLTIGNSSQSFANMALLPAVAVPAMLSAIAIPNFVKARSTAQQNACLNNLRMLDAAKQQWALEKGKDSSSVPTANDLKEYLGHDQMVVCPQGGTYTIGPVGESPKCSIPGHRLP